MSKCIRKVKTTINYIKEEFILNRNKNITVTMTAIIAFVIGVIVGIVTYEKIVEYQTDGCLLERIFFAGESKFLFLIENIFFLLLYYALIIFLPPRKICLLLKYIAVAIMFFNIGKESVLNILLFSVLGILIFLLYYVFYLVLIYVSTCMIMAGDGNTSCRRSPEFTNYVIESLVIVGITFALLFIQNLINYYVLCIFL